MNRLRVSAALLVLGALMTAPVFAAAGWTDYGTVGEFNQQGNTTPGNEMLFIRASVTSNPSGCSDSQSFYLPVVTDVQKRMFAMLLTAKSMGSRVRFWVTGSCHLWGSAEVQAMLIE